MPYARRCLSSTPYIVNNCRMQMYPYRQGNVMYRIYINFEANLQCMANRAQRAALESGRTTTINIFRGLLN